MITKSTSDLVNILLSGLSSVRHAAEVNYVGIAPAPHNKGGQYGPFGRRTRYSAPAGIGVTALDSGCRSNG